MKRVDWDSVGGEVTGLLQDLLRIDTTNPPGNDTACATHVAGVLRAEGIESVLLATGGTDAKWVSSVGTKVYGFFPMQYEAGVMALVHGHDERISISNLAFGTRVLFETVRRFCGEGAAT